MVDSRAVPGNEALGLAPQGTYFLFSGVCVCVCVSMSASISSIYFSHLLSTIFSTSS